MNAYLLFELKSFALITVGLSIIVEFLINMCIGWQEFMFFWIILVFNKKLGNIYLLSVETFFLAQFVGLDFWFFHK